MPNSDQGAADQVLAALAHGAGDEGAVHRRQAQPGQGGVFSAPRRNRPRCPPWCRPGRRWRLAAGRRRSAWQRRCGAQAGRGAIGRTDNRCNMTRRILCGFSRPGLTRSAGGWAGRLAWRWPCCWQPAAGAQHDRRSAAAEAVVDDRGRSRTGPPARHAGAPAPRHQRHAEPEAAGSCTSLNTCCCSTCPASCPATPQRRQAAGRARARRPAGAAWPTVARPTSPCCRR